MAKAAGVYVFGGGIDEGVPPVLVSAEGAVTEGGYPWAPRLDGGFTVLELPSRGEAIAWAARIAKACRCSQGAARSCFSFGSAPSMRATTLRESFPHIAQADCRPQQLA